MKELQTIQQKLKAPKDKRNNFGNYNYRSCEGILEAVKPLLQETDCTLILSDEIVNLGDRFYIQAKATLRNSSGEEVYTTAYAREDEVKKGMDGSQITGAASSYARKYALNGLFGIDDTKDADATNTHGQDDKGYTDKQLEEALGDVERCTSLKALTQTYNKWKATAPALCVNGSQFYKAVADANKRFKAA